MPGGGRASISGRTSFSSSSFRSTSYSRPSTSTSSSTSSSISTPSSSSSNSFLSWFIPYHFFSNNSKTSHTISSSSKSYKSKEDCKKYKEELDECLKIYSKDSLMYKIKESIYEDCIKKK